jgi:hypothetical protein
VLRWEGSTRTSVKLDGAAHKLGSRVDRRTVAPWATSDEAPAQPGPLTPPKKEKATQKKPRSYERGTRTPRRKVQWAHEQARDAKQGR